MPSAGAVTAIEKGLPANVEAEQFVLGSVLLSDILFAQVAGAVDADDFVLEKHRRIFARMLDLHTRSERIDYLTLTNELLKHGQLESCDGVAYISSLTEGLPRVENVDSYTRIVKDNALLRRMIYTAQNIVAQCTEAGGQDVDEILGRAEESVLRVGDSRVRGGLLNPRQIVDAFPGGVNTFLDPSKRLRGLTTGFTKFDELTTGLQPSELVVLAARPSMGKTALALNIAQHVAVKLGRPAAIFSLEMSKESLLSRLLCSLSRVDSHRFRGGFLNMEERRRLSGALGQLVRSPLYIDDSASTNLLEMHAMCRRLKSERGLALVVLDYLQLMSGKGRFENRNQEISTLSRGLKQLAKELEVPVVALSQLSRAPEVRTGDHRPQLSDLRESGSIEQDADLVGFIFREEVYKPDREDLHGQAELIVSKQRNGPTGKVQLAFLHKYAKFENRAEDVGESEPDADVE